MRKSIERPQQYVVLPPRGLRGTGPNSTRAVASFLASLNDVRSVSAARSFVAATDAKMKTDFKVLDSIHEDGAKLIEMSPDTAKDLQATQPGLRIVPVVYYRPCLFRHHIEQVVRTAARATKATLNVVSAKDQKPVAGALVVAFTDFANRKGDQGTTNAKGIVSLALSKTAKIERLYVYPKTDFWASLLKNVKLGIEVELKPVDLSFEDALRHYYGNAPDGTGTGVTVGVVDTGVGPHPDLQVAGGLNCVTGENPSDFVDNGEGHGTHVAGIIAARGMPPSGIRGLAPGVTLRSYRVFGKDAEGASNFAIAKAIDKATEDRCDLINLSLGGGPSDPATQSAIHDARARGCVVVAAAGNDGRQPVSFPGADPSCIAVSALGRKGTFPKATVDEGDIVAPFGTVDRDEYIAAFSNVGPEIDVTGTGVGIISTVPGGYAPLSGTSMASPAVAGLAARLLAGLPDVLAMTRDQDRSDAIAKALLQAAKDRGFPADLEGNGLPE